MKKMLLAEALLILALDENGSRGSPDISLGLAAGLLVDLSRRKALDIDADRLYVCQHAAIGHELLERTSDVIGSSKARTPQAWVRRLPRELKPIFDKVAGCLVDRGVLDHQDRKLFGWTISSRYRHIGWGGEYDLRESLKETLAGDKHPENFEGLLLGLVLAEELVGKLAPRQELPAARARAEEIASAIHLDSAVTCVVYKMAVAEIRAEAKRVARTAGFS